MIANSSPIPTSVPDEETKSESSNTQWWWPENQLGLDAEFNLQYDDQVEALDEKGEIKYHEAIAKYLNFT